ncbi:Cys/Met metabolism PLP-dependent enzyme-domain-containing protein [Melampsora americana]|nr:Cys/Met metabolism PLP-dependent enzyme-domain-containing protein [Melampsora americana]
MSYSKTNLPLSPLTRAIHEDQTSSKTNFNAFGRSIGPDISVSTNFKFNPPKDLIQVLNRLGENSIENNLTNSSSNTTTPLVQFEDQLSKSLKHDVNLHSYKRYSQPTLAKAESILSGLLNGDVLVYSSGVSAAFAALLHLQPDVIAIRDGYHGCHDTIKRYCQIRGMNERKSVEVKVIDLDDTYPPSSTGLKVLVWLETPVNPTGECRDIKSYAHKVRECALGSELLVDSTFAPPPLSNPFAFGADLVLHSGSKYIGGHSDALLGVLVVQKSKKGRWSQLWQDRSQLGLLPGSLETWLLIRSLKTLQIRVVHQSETAHRLAIWLNSLTERDYLSPIDLDEKRRMVLRVWHSGFQDAGKWVGFDSKTHQPNQMMGGGSPCFAIMLEKPIFAKWLPYLTKIFVPATSFGGVESLIQQQATADPNYDPRIIRLSIGLEDFNDLKNDLIQAFDRVIRVSD